MFILFENNFQKTLYHGYVLNGLSHLTRVDIYFETMTKLSNAELNIMCGILVLPPIEFFEEFYLCRANTYACENWIKLLFQPKPSFNVPIIVLCGTPLLLKLFPLYTFYLKSFYFYKYYTVGCKINKKSCIFVTLFFNSLF